MNLEVFEAEKHYTIISKWWDSHGWPTIPLGSLSQLGMIVFKDDIPLACGFLYDTDSDMAILEWIVGNPDADHEDRGEGLDLVIESLGLIAMSQGKKYIHTFCKHKRLIDRYKKFNFIEGDQNVTTMVRSL